MKTNNVLFNFDEVLLDQDRLEIAGWVLGRPPVTSLILYVPGPTFLRHRVRSYGLPSPDVAAALGPDGAAVRFHEMIPVSRDLSFRELANIKIVVETPSGNEPLLPICQTPSEYDIAMDKPLSDISLGIGVASYNRWQTLSQTLRRIKRHTRSEYHLVVGDDGSTDGTRQKLSELGTTCVGLQNRGIAWNKNRCLFYLANVKRCDVMILLEDDTFPTKDGWEIDWILAALAFGHVNYLTPWLKSEIKKGGGKWHSPYHLEDRLSGQCSAFSSRALSWVGYLDTRFGSYGHEHVEHTLRMIRAGFGGYAKDSTSRSSSFYALEGNITLADAASHGTADRVASNGRIFDEILNEGIYRPAWRNDIELATLRSEVLVDQEDAARGRQVPRAGSISISSEGGPKSIGHLSELRSKGEIPAVSARIPDSIQPAYWIRTFHETLLFYDKDDRCLRHRSARDAPRNLLLRIRGSEAHLFALSNDAASVRSISLERTGTSIEDEPHTSLNVARLAHTKAALAFGGNFLCCEPLQSRALLDRTSLSDWETFTLEPAESLPVKSSLASNEVLQASPSTAFLTVAGDFGGTWSLAAVNRRLALSLEQAFPGCCRIDRWDRASGKTVSELSDQLIELANRQASGNRPHIIIHQGWPVTSPKVRGDITVSYFFWEESLVPEAMIQCLNQYDAILVAAETVERALISSGCRRPVYNVGYSPDLGAFQKVADRQIKPIWRKTKPLTFLHVSAGDARKGVDILVRAYTGSFRKTDGVKLVIKGPPGPFKEWSEAAAALGGEMPVIETIRKDLALDDMCDLYRQADVMVLPTRGEGFNVPAAEAIAAGLRLIVTGWGGHMDFCTSGVARLVKFDMLPSPVFKQRASLWAEPDFDDLCTALKEAKSGHLEVDRALRDSVLQSLDRDSWIKRVRAAVDELEANTL